MSLEMQFYHKDLVQEPLWESQVEEILHAMQQTKCDWKELVTPENQYSTFLAFSPLRHNIIKWYPIKENANILEIGGHFGEMTEELLRKGAKVTTIVFSKKQAEIMQKRYANASHLTIVVGSLQDIHLQEKYDYITLFGVLEVAPFLFSIEKEKALDFLITFAKQNLAPNGSILMTTDNKLAIRNFAGAKYGKDSCVFDVLKEKDTTVSLWTKNEIVKALEELEMNNYQFFYPFPNATITNTIFSQNHLPTKNNSKLRYPLYFSPNDEILFLDFDVLKELAKDDYVDTFSNSFFIAIANETVVFDNWIGFNPLRKEEYQLMTKIGEEVVIKTPINKYAKKHIKNLESYLILLQKLEFYTIDKVENGILKSPFQNLPTLDEKLVSLVQKSNKKEVYELIKAWYTTLCQKLGVVEELNHTIFDDLGIILEKEQKSSFHFTSHGFLDLVFENIFLKDEEFIVYDQEWYLENIPLEWVLYRALYNWYFHYPEINTIISKTEMLTYFNLTKQVEILDKLENAWQETLVDDTTMQFYQSSFNRYISLEDRERKHKSQLENLNEELRVQREKTKELQLELDYIKNSRSWKYTNFLRKKK